MQLLFAFTSLNVVQMFLIFTNSSDLPLWNYFSIFTCFTAAVGLFVNIQMIYISVQLFFFYNHLINPCATVLQYSHDLYHCFSIFTWFTLCNCFTKFSWFISVQLFFNVYLIYVVQLFFNIRMIYDRPTVFQYSPHAFT